LQRFNIYPQLRRQFRFTRFRPLQLLPQHPRLLHALNRLRLRLHIQLKQPHLVLIPRSFASLAQKGYFDNTVCHRLTTAPDLGVLQCGDPNATGSGGPGYSFANEYPTNQYDKADPALGKPVLYPRGTLAMANAGPDTNGSQFFLVYKDSKLPPNYTVFGTIDSTGLATLDKIAAAGVGGGGVDGKPATEVKVKSVLLD
jgi:peptidyl-prolyl cis-trans isomerase B (cyclophilin B)